MKNLIYKYRYYITLAFIFLLYISLSSYYIYNSRLVGDGTFQTTFINDFYIKSNIDGYNDHLWGTYGFPRFQQYTLNYPALYHVLGVILYPYFLSKTLLIIDSLLLAVIALFLSYFVYKKTKSYFNSIFIAIFLLFSTLMISGGNNNLFLSTFVILAFLTLIEYFQVQKKQYLILFIIFSVVGFGAKQFYVFVYPFFLLLHLYMCIIKKETFKRFLLTNITIFLLILPIFYFQVKTTGTISTQTIEGWPIIDKVLKPRHVVGIENWQIEVDKKVNIMHLRELSERHYMSVNSGPEKLKENFFGTVQGWFNINGYTILPGSLKKNNLDEFIILFLILSLAFFLKGKSLKKENIFFSLAIIIPFIFIIKFTRRIEYALFFPIIILLFIGRYLPPFTKKIKAIILTSIFLFFIINISWYINTYIPFSQNNYMRSSVPYEYVEQTYSWIKTNVNSTDLILTSNTQDDPYYTDKKVFYDYRLWFLEKNDLKKYIPYYTNFNYILVFKPNIQEDFDNWNIVPANSPLLKDLLVDNELFTKVYENEYFYVFKKRT